MVGSAAACLRVRLSFFRWHRTAVRRPTKKETIAKATRVSQWWSVMVWGESSLGDSVLSCGLVLDGMMVCKSSIIFCTSCGEKVWVGDRWRFSLPLRDLRPRLCVLASPLQLWMFDFLQFRPISLHVMNFRNISCITSTAHPDVAVCVGDLGAVVVIVVGAGSRPLPYSSPLWSSSFASSSSSSKSLSLLVSKVSPTDMPRALLIWLFVSRLSSGRIVEVCATLWWRTGERRLVVWGWRTLKKKATSSWKLGLRSLDVCGQMSFFTKWTVTREMSLTWLCSSHAFDHVDWSAFPEGVCRKRLSKAADRRLLRRRFLHWVELKKVSNFILIRPALCARVRGFSCKNSATWERERERERKLVYTAAHSPFLFLNLQNLINKYYM